MKRYHKALSAVFCAAALCFCAGCSVHVDLNKNAESSVKESPKATPDEVNAPHALSKLGIDPGSLGIYPEVLHDEAHNPGFQLEPPLNGDTVAVVKTNMGEFTLRFFPEQAPKAVTNFINLAKSESYNATTFFEVLDGSYVKAGHCGSDPAYPNGVSSYGNSFEDEFCDSLFNIRGAVSMDNSSQDSNGSRFVINTATAEQFPGWASLEENWKNMKAQLESYKDSDLLNAFVDENGGKLLNTDVVPDSVKKLYEQNGGNPARDGAYNAADRGNTVFAQVIDGMDTVDKIAAVKTDKKNVPVKSVIIESVTIKTY